MMNREEALAWLVEKVKVWISSSCKEEWSKESPSGWVWAKKTGAWVLCSGNGDCISKQDLKDWQAAPPAPASNKPSWDDAPPDANILVQSENGKFNFGSFPNALVDSGGVWRGEMEGVWFKSIQCDPNLNWRDTLEFRPSKLPAKSNVVRPSQEIEGVEIFAPLSELSNTFIDTNINHVTTTNLSEELASISINKYNKPCKGITIDVYDVLKAFDVTCPAMQHAIKKCLMAGKRGAKDATQDMNEAIQSIERSKELLG